MRTTCNNSDIKKIIYNLLIISMDIQNRKKDISFLVSEANLLVLGVLGGLASCTAETFTFPLDNVKTRM